MGCDFKGVLKINASTRSLVGRLCDLKIYTISVLSFIGSACAPDKATLKAENHALQCTTAGPYNSIPSTLLGLVQFVVLVLTWWVFSPSALRPAYRVAGCSSTLSQGLENINIARGQLHSSFRSLSPIWEEEFPLPSMAFSTADAFWFCLSVGPWWHSWRSSTKQKGRKLQLACFWTNFINKTLLGLCPVAPREPSDRSVVIVLLTLCSTWSWYRVLLVLGLLLVSYPSSAVGSALHRYLTLKNMITPAVLDFQMNPTPSLITMGVPGCTTFTSLVTCLFLQSLQNGIDAFFFEAHHQHRPGFENLQNLGDCMKGRIRFMTAITLACAYAYHELVSLDTCLRSHTKTSPCRSQKPDTRIFTMIFPEHVQEAMIILGMLFFSDGGTRVVDGETLAGWSVISRFPRGRIWLKPFLVRTCALCFPFMSVAGFVLSKCLHFSFVVSHLFSWQVWATEHMRRYLRRQSLRKWVLLTVLPNLDGTGFRAGTMQEKINEIYFHLPLFFQNAARIENCCQTLA